MVRPPDVDALDFYNGLVELVQGRVKRAKGARELHHALSTVVAGLWADVDAERERLLVEFQLLTDRKAVLPGGVPIPPEFKPRPKRRPTLPPRLLDDRLPPRATGRTGT